MAFGAPKGKGMHLGRKSKASDIFYRVCGELGADADERAPLVARPRPPRPSRRSVSRTRPVGLDRSGHQWHLHAIRASIDLYPENRLYGFLRTKV